MLHRAEKACVEYHTVMTIMTMIHTKRAILQLENQFVSLEDKPRNKDTVS